MEKECKDCTPVKPDAMKEIKIDCNELYLKVDGRLFNVSSLSVVIITTMPRFLVAESKSSISTLEAQLGYHF